MSEMYPLLLEPIVLEKVWGGRRLELFGKVLPRPMAKYGESWELADMSATSASGAGGGAVRSVIANGAMKGKTLHEVMVAWGAGLVEERPHVAAHSQGQGKGGAKHAHTHGHAGNAPQPDLHHLQAHAFPLLVKFLDASENLSVQVHPSPEHARKHAGEHLKTECWYVLDAEPGSLIYKGVKRGVTRREFESLVRRGGSAVVGALEAVPAVAGEMHNLPSGTVHALGAGVMVAEVQTPSDTTYRLYDWGRMGRALHVEEGLGCASFPGEAGYEEMMKGMTVASLAEGEICGRLVTTEFFTVDELRAGDGDEVTIARSCSGSAGCCVLVTVGGAGTLKSRDGSFEAMSLVEGTTVVIPAGASERAWLSAGRGLRILRVGL